MTKNGETEINELIKNNKEFKNIRESRLKNIVKIISKKGLKDQENLFEIEEYKKYEFNDNEIIAIERLYYQKETEEIKEEDFFKKKKNLIEKHLENLKLKDYNILGYKHKIKILLIGNENSGKTT
jgi:polynucleotide 5'-kinase involved in rRNA processing